VVKCSACVVRDYGREAEAHDVLRVSHPSHRRIGSSDLCHATESVDS
jgi:hypothetical protein